MNELAARAWAACGRQLQVRVTLRDETSHLGVIERIVNEPSEKLRQDGGSTLTLVMVPEAGVHLNDVDRINLER